MSQFKPSEKTTPVVKRLQSAYSVQSNSVKADENSNSPSLTFKFHKRQDTSNLIDFSQMADRDHDTDAVFHKMLNLDPEEEEYQQNWLDGLDKMHLAEKLKDLYNDRKTLNADKTYSRRRTFYL